MKKCRNHCEMWNADDAKFCRYCGIHMPVLSDGVKYFRIGLYLGICLLLGVLGFGGVAKGDGDLLLLFEGASFSQGSLNRGILWFWCAILVFNKVLRKMWDKWDEGKRGNPYSIKQADKNSHKLIGKLEDMEKKMKTALEGGSLQGDNRSKIEDSLKKVTDLKDKLSSLRLAAKMWETDNKVVGFTWEPESKRWPISRKLEYMESFVRQADSWKKSKDFLSKVENLPEIGPEAHKIPDQILKNAEDYKASVALHQADHSHPIKPVEPSDIYKVDLESIYEKYCKEALSLLPAEPKR